MPSASKLGEPAYDTMQAYYLADLRHKARMGNLLGASACFANKEVLPVSPFTPPRHCQYQSSARNFTVTSRQLPSPHLPSDNSECACCTVQQRCIVAADRSATALCHDNNRKKGATRYAIGHCVDGARIRMGF